MTGLETDNWNPVMKFGNQPFSDKFLNDNLYTLRMLIASLWVFSLGHWAAHSHPLFYMGIIVRNSNFNFSF